MLKGRGLRFVTVSDRGWIKLVKSIVHIHVRFGKAPIAKYYNYTNTIY